MFPIWINKAIELRKDGLSYAKIGKLLNTDRKKVSYYLQEKGYQKTNFIWQKCF